MTSIVIYDCDEMRASRLLQILLILQNRGRQTSAKLASELEVTPRTILRDVDAMTEAGLPIIVHQGNQGGIELGFNYRTRLTGLAQDEAEALGIILTTPNPMLDAIELSQPAARARAKLIESLPDRVRQTAKIASTQFISRANPADKSDRRIPALAHAIRNRRIIRVNARSKSPRLIHATALTTTPDGWFLFDKITNSEIPLSGCGDINISVKTFAPDLAPKTDPDY